MSALWNVTTLPTLKSRTVTTNIALSLLGALSLALLTRASVGLPVPYTLQTLGLLLLAAILGPRWGTLAVLEYLAMGACGAPVFTKNLGLLTFLGPTGGYLFAFPVATLLSGMLYSRIQPGSLARNVLYVTLAGLVSMAVIYLGGWAWLSHLVGAQKAFMLGVAPFILFDAAKSVVVAVVVLRQQRVVGE